MIPKVDSSKKIVNLDSKDNPKKNTNASKILKISGAAIGLSACIFLAYKNDETLTELGSALMRDLKPYADNTLIFIKRFATNYYNWKLDKIYTS